MQRRSFLSGILAAGIAPAVLSRSSIMGLWVPRQPTVLTLEAVWVQLEAVWVHKDRYGMRGYRPPPFFLGQVICNERWMNHS